MDKNNNENLNEKYSKIYEYLNKAGLIEQLEWQSLDVYKLVRLITSNNIKFEGEECGYLKFFTKNGKKYIQYVPDKICVDNLNELIETKNDTNDN